MRTENWLGYLFCVIIIIIALFCASATHAENKEAVDLAKKIYQTGTPIEGIYGTPGKYLSSTTRVNNRFTIRKYAVIFYKQDLSGNYYIMDLRFVEEEWHLFQGKFRIYQSVFDGSPQTGEVYAQFIYLMESSDREVLEYEIWKTVEDLTEVQRLYREQVNFWVKEGIGGRRN